MAERGCLLISLLPGLTDCVSITGLSIEPSDTGVPSGVEYVVSSAMKEKHDQINSAFFYLGEGGGGITPVYTGGFCLP